MPRQVLVQMAQCGMDDTEVQHSCEACQVLDQVDGQVDGKLYKVSHYAVRNERNLVRELKQFEDRVADRVTSFAGSLRFVYLHAAWFVVWIVLNAGAVGASLVFDGFPYGLLTMIVSLEAIFLSTFVMVSQNRQAARSDLRADLDFENNVRSEIWSVHIGQVLGIDVDHVEHVVRAALVGYREEQAKATTG